MSDAAQTLRSEHRRHHAVDYRISVSCLGQQIYLVLLMGADERSKDRLTSDGQIRSLTLLLLKLALLMFACLAFVCMILGAAVIFSLCCQVHDGN